MPFDAHSNFGYSTVSTAPVPALTGISLTVAAGQGALFPIAPFNCTVWPADVQPLASNAEIVRVTAIVGDTLTITREQEGTAAVAIAEGYQIANTTTVKVFTDIEAAIGGGSVTSVGLTADASIFTITNSPIVGAGDIDLSLTAQNANKVLAGPTTGADAVPTFRQIIEDDLALTDITNNNATTGRHGFLAKLSNVAKEFLNGVGAFASLFSESTLTYANPATIDFSSDDFRTVTLTGDIVFQSSNLAAGKCISVRIIGDGSDRAIGFPGTWIFVGSAAPTTLAAGKTAILSATSFSNTDANVIAAYSAEP